MRGKEGLRGVIWNGRLCNAMYYVKNCFAFVLLLSTLRHIQRSTALSDY